MSDRDDILRRARDLAAAARELDDPALLDELRRVFVEPVSEPTEAGADEFCGMLGAAPAVQQMFSDIKKFAPTPMPVLILGESGTGKELVARALHTCSQRRGGPFVSENCAAIPETLLESVLFGHVKGSFTGAIKDHAGHFVAAHGGTLFLDEIGDMPLAMQAKILRALQEGEVRPVGGNRARKVDVRVVAATNRDLEEMVAQGKFRQDLFYRLNVLRVLVPPLRARSDDIVVLARHFLLKAAAHRPHPPRLSAAAEDVLRQARWPGNIRQLINEMQRVAALVEGDEVRPSDLSRDL
ncbi:MAG: sigma-54 dependent transcriptional regulator [Planctomycetota bacterium]